MSPDRRRFLAASSLAATGFAAAPALWATRGVFAEELGKTLARTPAQTEGPFYPDKLPLDTDNDLLRLNDDATPALGEVTHLTGRVLTTAGEPVRGATVEIWQCDANGNYIHTRGGSEDRRDAGFQGFGRFLTDSTGRYYFRTIKPVPYGGRTPHIHVAVDRGASRLLTTQCYIKGFPQNARDGVFRSLRDEAARGSVAVPFEPLGGSTVGELAANFDIVLGATPADAAAADPGDAARPRGRRLGRGFDAPRLSEEQAPDTLLGEGA